MKVTLWDMLTIMAGAMAFAGAYVAASERGGGDLILACVAGVVVGFGCIAFVRKLGNRVLRRVEAGRSTGTGAYWLIRLVYVFAVAWLVISNILGFQLVKLILSFLA